MRLEHVAGSLAPGRRADVTLLQEIEGRFRFDDCFGNKRLAERTGSPLRAGGRSPARSHRCAWR